MSSQPVIKHLLYKHPFEQSEHQEVDPPSRVQRTLITHLFQLSFSLRVWLLLSSEHQKAEICSIFKRLASFLLPRFWNQLAGYPSHCFTYAVLWWFKLSIIGWLAPDILVISKDWLDQSICCQVRPLMLTSPLTHARWVHVRLPQSQEARNQTKISPAEVTIYMMICTRRVDSRGCAIRPS